MLVNRASVANKYLHTHLSRQSPLKILGNSNAPPFEMVCNAYELKTHLKLINYYHAVVGFPTKFTWLKAIKNGRYTSWTDLTSKAVESHFPKSEETWKGHRQKSDLASTQANQRSKTNDIH